MMADMRHTSIYFKLTGRAFRENGAYVHTTTKALQALQYIFDRSYLALAGRKKITRSQFYLLAREFRQGSFISYIDIVAVSQSVLSLWEFTRLAFDLLKTVFSPMVREGESGPATYNSGPVINISGENATVIVNDVEKVVYPAVVVPIAEQALSGYRRLGRLLRSGEVDEVIIGEVDGYMVDARFKELAIVMRYHEAMMLEERSYILPGPIAVECEIFLFDKDKGVGRLRIFAGQPIPEGEYNFKVDERYKDAIIWSMSEKRVRFLCKQEIVFNPFAPERTKIVKLHLLH